MLSHGKQMGRYRGPLSVRRPALCNQYPGWQARHSNRTASTTRRRRAFPGTATAGAGAGASFGDDAQPQPRHLRGWWITRLQPFTPNSRRPASSTPVRFSRARVATSDGPATARESSLRRRSSPDLAAKLLRLFDGRVEPAAAGPEPQPSRVGIGTSGRFRLTQLLVSRLRRIGLRSYGERQSRDVPARAGSSGPTIARVFPQC